MVIETQSLDPEGKGWEVSIPKRDYWLLKPRSGSADCRSRLSQGVSIPKRDYWLLKHRVLLRFIYSEYVSIPKRDYWLLKQSSINKEL